MRRRVLLSLAVLGVGAGLFAAAGLGRSAQTRGGTLRIGFTADLDYVDPALAYEAVSWMIESATCAKLYGYPDLPGSAGTRVIPEVAVDFPRPSKDGKTQTIELKRTYRFHTGARLTATNFVAAFNRDVNPKLQSGATQYMHEIVGADAAIAGKTDTIAGVKALGPYTLQLRTTKPLHDLADRLTMPFFCPIAANTPPRPITNPPGSGPYYLASYVPNRLLRLERNRFYHGPRQANVDHVVFSEGIGLEACRQAVEQDELDWCAHIPTDDYRPLAKKYGINRPNGQFFFTPTLETDYFAFNHDRPAFKGAGQVPLKKAINLVIDRPALVRTFGYLGARRTDQILPPALGRDDHIYPISGVSAQAVTKARALLASAEIKPEKITLYVCSCPFRPFAPEAQLFKYALARLGIDVEIKYFSLDELVNRVGTRGEPYDVVDWVWIPDWGDGISVFGPLLDGRHITKVGNQNYANFDRPKANREIDRIDGLTGDARRPAWADLDLGLMRDDPPWAPFANYSQVDFVSKSFGCFVPQPLVGRIDLVAACKK